MGLLGNKRDWKGENWRKSPKISECCSKCFSSSWITVNVFFHWSEVKWMFLMVCGSMFRVTITIRVLGFGVFCLFFVCFWGNYFVWFKIQQKYFFKSGINRFVSCLGVEKGVVCENGVFFLIFGIFLMKNGKLWRGITWEWEKMVSFWKREIVHNIQENDLSFFPGSLSESTTQPGSWPRTTQPASQASLFPSLSLC